MAKCQKQNPYVTEFAERRQRPREQGIGRRRRRRSKNEAEESDESEDKAGRRRENDESEKTGDAARIGERRVLPVTAAVALPTQMELADESGSCDLAPAGCGFMGAALDMQRKLDGSTQD